MPIISNLYFEIYTEENEGPFMKKEFNTNKGRKFSKKKLISGETQNL